MSVNKITILAIAVGARAIGFAIFKTCVLQYYSVKRVPTGTPRKVVDAVQQQITRLITTFQPDVLAVKQIVATQTDSALVKATMNRIKAIDDKYKLELLEYTTKTVRKALCQSTSSSRQDVIATIARLYPELTPFLKRTRKWEHAYYGNMLDAIAVGVVCAQEMNARSE